MLGELIQNENDTFTPPPPHPPSYGSKIGQGHRHHYKCEKPSEDYHHAMFQEQVSIR